MFFGLDARYLFQISDHGFRDPCKKSRREFFFEFVEPRRRFVRFVSGIKENFVVHRFKIKNVGYFHKMRFAVAFAADRAVRKTEICHDLRDLVGDFFANYCDLGFLDVFVLRYLDLHPSHHLSLPLF